MKIKFRCLRMPTRAWAWHPVVGYLGDYHEENTNSTITIDSSGFVAICNFSSH